MSVFDEESEQNDGLAGIQHLHTDQQPGSPGYVMLAALDDTVTLVVCLKSHKAVASCFESTDEGSPYAKAQEAQFLELCDEYPPVRIELQKGYVYVMDANLVHAGDAGKRRQYSPRMHYNMITDKLADETFILNSQGGKFAAKFHGRKRRGGSGGSEEEDARADCRPRLDEGPAAPGPGSAVAEMDAQMDAAAFQPADNQAAPPAAEMDAQMDAATFQPADDQAEPPAGR